MDWHRVSLLATSFALSCTVVVAQEPLPTQLFQPTKGGDWVTTISDPDGTRRYVFVPSNKFTATVRVATVLQDVAAGSVAYRYVVANSATSQQSIGMFGVNAGEHDRPRMPVSAMPAGWMAVPVNGGFALTPEARINPGQQVVVRMEGRGLPGVVIASLSESPPILTIPDGLSSVQRDELESLSLRFTTSEVATIGPILALDSELASTVSKVVWHYRAAFADAKHPQAESLIAVSAAGTEASTLLALAALGRVAAAPTSDVWHGELSRALAVCVEILRAKR